MSFRFKQFFADDSRCAMKVGTDGVLLGAWAPVDNFKSQADCRVLDIGTGCGLVALMLAQRLPMARITAIDIDSEAALQAADNFSRSPWSDRLDAVCSSAQAVSRSLSSLGNIAGSFHLIVSNPPYFRNSLKNPDAARTLARHSDTLSMSDLLKSCFRRTARWLSYSPWKMKRRSAVLQRSVISLSSAVAVSWGERVNRLNGCCLPSLLRPSCRRQCKKTLFSSFKVQTHPVRRNMLRLPGISIYENF